MSEEIYGVLTLAAIAIALLVLDRFIRINPFLVSEGFQVDGYNTRCGIDLPPCQHPNRCINGFCCTSEFVQMRDRNPLPVIP
jgi:hypothetical protein